MDNDLQLDKLEGRLTSHIEQTNDKLDALIELTKMMATVQERQNRHSDDIKRIEQQQINDRSYLSGMYEKFDIKLATIELERKQVTQRIFDKMDEALIKKSAETLHMHEEVEKDMDKVLKKIDDLAIQVSTLSTDYNAKTNFTKGAIWILGIALGAGQLALTSYFSDFKTKIENISAAISVQDSRTTDTEQQMQLFQQQLNILRSNTNKGK